MSSTAASAASAAARTRSAAFVGTKPCTVRLNSLVSTAASSVFSLRPTVVSRIGRGIANIQFTQAPADATNLARDAHDVVHCRFLLSHVVEPLPAIREMEALAKPGGLVIAFEMDANGLPRKAD